MITFHSARHTQATLLLSHGVDIYTVSKLLDHKHIVSTERYLHMADNLKVEAINKHLPYSLPIRSARSDTTMLIGDHFRYRQTQLFLSMLT